MMTEPVPAYLFRTPEFAACNLELFTAYAQHRVHGYHSMRALWRAFGEENCDNNAAARIHNIESNPAYVEIFAKLLKDTAVDKLWNTKVAVNELLMLARDVYAKETVRLNAVKELNILCGITVVDENGKTKAGRTLKDFYAGIRAQTAAAANESGVPVASSGQSAS